MASLADDIRCAPPVDEEVVAGPEAR
jgi:hypothetical protein